MTFLFQLKLVGEWSFSRLPVATAQSRRNETGIPGESMRMGTSARDVVSAPPACSTPIPDAGLPSKRLPYIWRLARVSGAEEQNCPNTSIYLIEPGFATEPFEARKSGIVKKKINLLRNRSIRPARLFGRTNYDVARFGRRHSLAELRVLVFILFLPKCSSSAPASCRFRTNCLPACCLKEPQRSIFLRWMEVEDLNSPLFGIMQLKRFSRFRIIPHSQSREHLIPHE